MLVRGGSGGPMLSWGGAGPVELESRCSMESICCWRTSTLDLVSALSRAISETLVLVVSSSSKISLCITWRGAIAAVTSLRIVVAISVWVVSVILLVKASRCFKRSSVPKERGRASVGGGRPSSDILAGRGRNCSWRAG